MEKGRGLFHLFFLSSHCQTWYSSLNFSNPGLTLNYNMHNYLLLALHHFLVVKNSWHYFSTMIPIVSLLINTKLSTHCSIVKSHIKTCVNSHPNLNWIHTKPRPYMDKVFNQSGIVESNSQHLSSIITHRPSMHKLFPNMTQPLLLQAEKACGELHVLISAQV